MPEKAPRRYVEAMNNSEFDRRRLTRREPLVDDPSEGTTSIAAREFEIIFEQIMELNKKYGRDFDRYMPRHSVSNLQDLEDYVGDCYNNYNSNAEVRYKDV